MGDRRAVSGDLCMVAVMSTPAAATDQMLVHAAGSLRGAIAVVSPSQGRNLRLVYSAPGCASHIAGLAAHTSLAGALAVVAVRADDAPNGPSGAFRVASTRRQRLSRSGVMLSPS
jgi:hypothetical protein